jgi:hypothetical protein
MKKTLNLFEKIIFTEAPGDPPDLEDPSASSGPPNLPEVPQDDSGGGLDGGAPPDLEGGDLGGEDEMGGFEDEGNMGMEGDGTEAEEELELDEKISAIMNQNLYQRYLALLNNVGNQLSMIKNHSDVLYTLSNDSLEVIGSLKKLDENIRLYLANTFLTENYSKNLLFFNKCLNLLKLLNDIFEKNIRKGIKAAE